MIGDGARNAANRIVGRYPCVGRAGGMTANREVVAAFVQTEAVAPLAEALKKYGRHAVSCPKSWGYGDRLCSCGLDAVLKKVGLAQANSTEDLRRSHPHMVGRVHRLGEPRGLGPSLDKVDITRAEAQLIVEILRDPEYDYGGEKGRELQAKLEAHL